MHSVPHAEVLAPPQTPEFLAAHEGIVSETLNVLQLADEWDGTLTDAFNITQPWVTGDHGHKSYSFNLTEQQKRSLDLLYPKLDMVEQRDLAPGHYDHILVLGAVHLGNDKRVRFLRDMVEDNGVTADKIFLMGGQRAIFPKREPDDVVHNLENLRAKGELTGWLKYFLDKPLSDVNETDMLRVAMLDRLGPLALKGLTLQPASDASDKRIPKRYEFEWQGMPVYLTHTRAVRRKDGDPRHTTETCIAEWARTYMPADDARVAFLGSRPHLDRMVRSAERRLRSMGSNLSFIAGGPGTTRETGHTIYLGEVARHLYEDMAQAGLLKK